MYTLTDTHTHIYYQTDRAKRAEQLQNCLARNVRRLFLPNVDTESIAAVFDTVAAYPEHCFPMLGLHPCSVKEDYKRQLQVIESALAAHKVYAIGEIGLDLYWDRSTLEMQKDAFRKQVGWAKDLRLPIDIHCREAFAELFEILDELRDDRLFGILHCFTGTLEQAQRAINLGFALGIGGVVTYKKSRLDAVVRAIGLRHIVLETDAPYLAPVPFRGKENQSAYLHYVAEKVAELHGISIAELADITTENAKRIFGV